MRWQVIPATFVEFLSLIDLIFVIPRDHNDIERKK